MTKRILYSLALGIVELYIWYTLYKAGFKDYDENFGLLIHAFIVSLAAHVIVAILWFMRNKTARDAKYQHFAFLVIASPATVVLVMMKYELIFQISLRVN